MGDLLLLLALSAAILGYASLLISMRLRAGGAPPARIRLALIELWGTFIVIIGLFAVIRSLLGDVGGDSVFDGLRTQLERLRALSAGMQATIILAMLIALGLFVHLIWMLQRLNNDYATPHGGNHE